MSARLEIRWYRNDDFGVHYREERRDGASPCRWVRRPNAHSSQERVYPPSDAVSYFGHDLVRLRGTVADHRDACRLVLDAIEDRLETPRE